VFAFGRGDSNKLYILDFNGRDPRLIDDTIDTRGRSDWSSGDLIVFDMGGPFQHDVYVMNLDGKDLHKFTDGNNSQGASFFPMGNGSRGRLIPRSPTGTKQVVRFTSCP